MSTVLGIALLLIATISTLAAFGGETWKADGGPLLTRITPRGWASLICLLLTLFVGTLKEVKDAADAKFATTQAEEKRQELQASLDAAQGQITLLRTQTRKTQEQVTGSGFPIVSMIPKFSDSGSFPLYIEPNGDAPLLDVSYKVLEGPAPSSPTPEELKKMETDAVAILNGQKANPIHNIGEIDPHKEVSLNYSIRPSRTGISTYRIVTYARNGETLETLDVQFNGTMGIWQYRYQITSEDSQSPNKLLAKEDWVPSHN